MLNRHFLLRLLVQKDVVSMKRAAFLARRPHRSFRRTRRRDYVRSLKLPGYWAFSAQVLRLLQDHKATFWLLVVLYALVILLVGGLANQSAYNEAVDILKSTAEENVGIGGFLQAGLLVGSTFLTPGQITPEQQIYLSVSGLFVWLTVVWLLRGFMAGRAVKLRDGLYRSGAPIVSTGLVSMVALVQLTPVFVAILVYTGLTAGGYLSEGFSMMIFWLFAVACAVLSLYWLTATFLALVIITIPGIYPMRAIKAAGDLVVGRRIRVLYRLLWLAMLLVVAWFVTMAPLIALESGLKASIPALEAVPFVPIAATFMMSLSVVWAAAYVYTLYRRMLDDGSKPA